ncbi:unnamed protein product [Linum tenue]|uniref:VQ domain-containing protein n=1 Tax=Linum tenue TaxID=586396 RepID=A0AAV0GNV9_9ROSI|nr:unnamed protein product [Linum tenue]
MIHMESLVMDMKAAATKKNKRNRGSNRGGNHKVLNEPMKVVYISNPMKFEIGASEFRSLVQELTGQDAEFPPSLRRRHHSNNPPAAAASNSSLDNSSSNCSSPTTTTASSSTLTAATVDSCVGGEFRRTVGAGGHAAPSPEEEEQEDQDTPLAGFEKAEEEQGMLLVDEQQFDVGGEFVPEMLENSAAFHSWHLDFDFAEWN